MVEAGYEMMSIHKVMIGKWAVHALEPAFETVAQSKPLKLMFCIFSFFSDFKSIPFCFIIYCLSA